MFGLFVYALHKRPKFHLLENASPYVYREDSESRVFNSKQAGSEASMRTPDLKVQHRSELVHSIPVHQANEAKFILPAKGGKRGNPTVRYNV